ncbi:HIT domain-containing protein [Candidatus Parcubacteria bacterium]|nr:HIT domain-containing protein [Candidatus Parcubacteria bacterium]
MESEEQGCIFCRISRGEIPKEFILRDDRVMAFDDIRPSAPVHVLVVPREHIVSIAHLTEDHRDVLPELIYAAKRIAADRKLEGYKLVFNVGRRGGQVIDHLHLHLLGGWDP